MAFPFIFSASFDRGTNAEWDSEADTGSLLDFPHYVTMAAIPGYPAPYRGAYVMRITPGDTNDHTLLEGDLNIADAATAWVRFALFISGDFAATADDIFNIFEWQETGNTVEACISLRITADGDAVDIAIADGTEASSGFTSLSKGRWHMIEALFTVDVSPGTNGVLELYVDGRQVQRVTGHNQSGAITHGVLGTQGTLNTTATGFILFDDFAFDDTRLALTRRWELNQFVTANRFIFVGPGELSNVKLLDGGSGDVTLELYDTDEYAASMVPVWRGRTAAANTDVDAADVPIKFSRGCLAIIGGTTPAAMVTVDKAVAWGSDGAVRSYATRRGVAKLGN